MSLEPPMAICSLPKNQYTSRSQEKNNWLLGEAPPTKHSDKTKLFVDAKNSNEDDPLSPV